MNAFNARKPWTTAIVCLLLGPFTGMLVISKGRIALSYALVNIIVSVLPFVASTFNLITIDPVQIWWIPSLFVGCIAAVHAILIQRNPAFVPARKWYSSWHAALSLGLVLPIILAFTVREFVLEGFHSASGSMRPTMSTNKNFFAYKIPYKTGQKIERGDIVVFSANNLSYVKRVVGLPNEKIQMIEGILHINSIPVTRQYLRDDSTVDDGEVRIIYRRYTETFPEGNEHDIYEISDEMPLDKTELYLVPQNSYFLMGDNRDHSLDSRILDKIGFIKSDQIKGKALYFYWDAQDKKMLWQKIK